MVGLEAEVSYAKTALKLAGPEDKAMMEYNLDNLQIKLDVAKSYLESLVD